MLSSRAGDSGKQPLKAEDVPRIGEGAAGDAALQQVLDLRQARGRRRQAALVGLDLPAGEPAEDLAQQPHRHGGNALGLDAAGVGIAHLGEEQGQVTLLQLHGAVAGQVGVEVLAGAAERLPGRRLLLAQPGRVRPLPVARATARKTHRDSGRCAAAAWPGSSRNRGAVGPLPLTPGGHQHRAGQDGRRLVKRSSRSSGRAVCDAVEQGVQRDLADDVAAIAALVVEMMRVPFAEDVIRPAIDRMAVVVGAHVNGQLVEQIEIELRLGSGGADRCR